MPTARGAWWWARIAPVLAAVVALGGCGVSHGVPGARRAVAHRHAGPDRHQHSRSAGRSGPASLTVGRPGRAIPPGFLGLSMEMTSLEDFAGSDPRALDPVFVQLIDNLTPGQRPVIRLGGDTTDWSWAPIRGMPQPPWVRFVVTGPWLAVARALSQRLDARLILGVNLEADSARIAGSEARAMLAGIGAAHIEAFELGNEPELYASFAWYKRGNVGVPGRARSWGPSAYIADFHRISRALPRSVPLAGPAVGSVRYFHALGAFLKANPSVSLVTLHAYPTKHCPRARRLVTAAQLLSESASLGLADSLEPYVSIARRLGKPLRVDEINAVSCGGQPGLSDSYVTALWSVDALFALANAGVAGVNVHTNPGTPGELFAILRRGGRWYAQVNPIYYGLELFAQAAPAGSRLLHLSGAVTGATRAWATQAPNGQIRVLVINARPRRAVTVIVHARPGSGGGAATVEELRAPGLLARSGITLGGQTLGAQTDTGRLAGRARIASLSASRGSYRLRLPAASAALLTLPAPRP
jgi:hypothetical protein